MTVKAHIWRAKRTASRALVRGRRTASAPGPASAAAAVTDGGPRRRRRRIGIASAPRVHAAGASFVEADICDRQALDAALEGTELLVHTAAFVHEWGSMGDFIRVNVRGTANVLDSAESVSVERVIHLSSVVVYG